MSSSNVRREDGVTIVDLGHRRIKTDMINRHRYNDLRKKDTVSLKDVLWALRESGKGFQG